MIRRNDIVFREGAYHHTMVVSNPMNYASVGTLLTSKPLADQTFKGSDKAATAKDFDQASDWGDDIEVIHAASVDSGVYRERLNIPKEEANGNVFRFYRPTDPRLSNGVEFATLWAHYRHRSGTTARKAPDGKRAQPFTEYSYDQKSGGGVDFSRYSGVQDQLKAGANPPFEFDALYRAFKWANRMRSGFSKNRGITCCAFITACFQAAAVDHFTGDFRKTKAGFDMLSQLRGDKASLRTIDVDDPANYIAVGGRKKLIAKHVLRSNNNPGGFSDRFDVNDYCRFITKELRGTERTIEDIFPSGVLVDAKFNYSRNFENLIATGGSGFIKVL